MKLKDLMKLFLLGACACTFAAGELRAQEAADDDEEEAPKPKKKKAKKGKKAAAPSRMIVAIDKFDNKAGATATQFETLRARIQHRVLGTRKFEVMEREQLKSALSEQKLSAAGVTNGDDVNAPEAGKLKAAGYVLYGNILFFGKDDAQGSSANVESMKKTTKVELQLKITNAENGKVLASKVVTGVGTLSKIGTEGVSQKGNYSEQTERAAVDNAAAMVVDALRDLCYPAKIVAVGKKNVTINMTAEEVQEDDIFDVIEAGEPMVDPDTGAFLGNDGDDVGRIRITRPGPMSSKAVPEDDLDLDDIEVGYIVRRAGIPLSAPGQAFVDAVRARVATAGR